MGGNVFLEAINGDINTGNINVSFLDNAGNAIANGGDISLIANGNILVNNAEIRSEGRLGGKINLESHGSVLANNSVIFSSNSGNVLGK